MKTVSYFKATKQTPRFNKNQKVWISLDMPNCMYVYYRYRGKGRYVTGMCNKDAKYIGEIKTIEVSDSFAARIES